MVTTEVVDNQLIQQNWTDILLDNELIKLGVNRDDIVLGFLPTYAREQSGYTVI